MDRSRARVSGIVLAAGAATRLGGDVPKPLVLWRGRPLVRRAAEAALASRLAEVVVVLGHRADDVRAGLEGLDVRVVVNARHREGQSTSVRAGLAAVSGDAGAALFLPCDQPHLDAGVLDLLIDAWRTGDRPIVVPVFRGRRGAPVLFDRALFGELDRIRGDEGGRQILPAHAADIREVELASELPLLDVDAPGDRDAVDRNATEDEV